MPNQENNNQIPNLEMPKNISAELAEKFAQINNAADQGPNCKHCQLLYNLFSEHTDRLTKFIETLLNLIIQNFTPPQQAEPDGLDPNLLSTLTSQLIGQLSGPGQETVSQGGKYPNV